MNTKTLFFVLLLGFICSACHRDEGVSRVITVDVDITSEEQMKLSDYFYDFDMIRLDTSDDCIIGEIIKMMIIGRKIYITDGHSIFVYNVTGNLLSGFNKTGKGPGEYQRITDFTVDDGYITVLNGSHRNFLTYDESGELISECKIDCWGQAISPAIAGHRLLYCGNDMNDNNTYKLEVIKDCQTISRFLPVDANQAEYLHITGIPCFFQQKDDILFYETFNDTIYTTAGDNNGIDPLYYINYNGKNIPTAFFAKKYATVYDFFQDLHRTDYAYGVARLAENDQTLMFGSFYRKKMKLTFYRKQDKTTHTFSTIKDDVFFDSDISEVSDFNSFAEGNRIILPVDAPRVLELRDQYKSNEKYKEIIRSVKETNNPILLTFKLK